MERQKAAATLKTVNSEGLSRIKREGLSLRQKAVTNEGLSHQLKSVRREGLSLIQFLTASFVLAVVLLLPGKAVFAHGVIYSIAYKTDNTAEITLKSADVKDTKGIVPEYFFLKDGKVLTIAYHLKQGAKKQVVIKYDLASALPPIGISLVNTGDKSWNPFKDIRGIEAEPYIRQLHDAGIIEPGTDGKFNPKLPVTRADLASMIVKALKLNENVKNTWGFKDIEKNGARKEILLAVKYGLISGYSNKTFRPGGKVTLAEVCTVLSRTYNFKTSKNVIFSKQKKDKWYSKNVKKMFDAGILKTDDALCKNFNEESNITRADCAMMISRALTTY